MKKSNKDLWTKIALAGVVLVGGYFAWTLIQREIQKRAIKRALEEGCELAIKEFEDDKEEIAEDLARLIGKMGDMDQEKLAEELQEIKDDIAPEKE